MLFAYPVAATAENWLHECLIQILQSINASIQAGEVPAKWPTIVPTPHRGTLKSRHGFKNKLKKYEEKFLTLSAPERNQVSAALTDQNRIPELLACVCNCESIEALPATIREEIKDLGVYCFGLLSDLGIRDSQYSNIYSNMPDHVCPFCGCEYFDAPGAPREDFDHYMDKVRYPFVAANLRNLVPMGMKCNQRHKGTVDILKRADGTRRRAFDPYGTSAVRVSLENSITFAGENGKAPNWQIDLLPATEEIDTWDDVFRIRERYTRDVLNPSFDRWLTQCSQWCRRMSPAPSTRQEILSAIAAYADTMADMGFSERAFLKEAVFRMLYIHCENGDERLFSVIQDLVTGDISILPP
jgi:hypothetical protein